MDDSPNAHPFCVEFEINEPRVAKRYYSRHSKIDERNSTRQDDFQLERKLQTKDWSINIYTSILGMDDYDNYYIGRACYWWDDRNPEEFYYNLTEEMIDNWWTERST